MTKTKAQLRAEAVERLRARKEEGSFIEHIELYAILLDSTLEEVLKIPNCEVTDALIDLLTDDCGPCYSCAKLAELMAENSQLRGIVGDLKVPTDPGEASMMSVDAFIKKQTEHESLDSREKLEADMRERLGELWANAWDAGSRDSMDDDFDIDVFSFLLDRQEAITEREIFDEMPHVRDRLAEQDSAIAEYAEKNAELAAQLESAHAKNRSLKTHIAKMQEGRHGWHVKYPELEKKNAELQHEVDRLTSENISFARDLGECMAERDGWRYRWHQVRVLMDEPLQSGPRALMDMNGEVVD